MSDKVSNLFDSASPILSCVQYSFCMGDKYVIVCHAMVKYSEILASATLEQHSPLPSLPES